MIKTTRSIFQRLRGKSQVAHGTMAEIDAAAKFHDFLYINGWFHCPDSSLVAVNFEHLDIEFFRAEVGLPHGGVLALGPDKGFRCQIIKSTSSFPAGGRLIFHTSDGKQVAYDFDEMISRRLANVSTAELHGRFLQRLQAPGFSTMLDIGGRARSAVDRSALFPHHEVTVLDIAPGDNVHVVGDAHQLSSHFPAGSFDAVYSVSVFEHLLMPWKVALEMNRVLRMGGIAYIHTHQTLGLHDMPWDFWRFSDTSWDGLFNKLTGFKIIGRAMAHEHFLIPFIWRPDKHDAEYSAGYESSAVYLEKTGECTMEWPIKLDQIIKSQYPPSV
ncbi:class I SAM-dependent methyltransferase [Sphingobium fluviale]|uniref:Class I SAM-dependent methyltransferase n=2 Tax=Sphingobium fluviale TaxID=2506423 RepID=A0A4Q1KIH2_9SPHN|nr:class I SAM-dependent methyltransferase [Sphingobium fluviale]